MNAVEMDAARLRALTHKTSAYSISINVVEMDEARLRALTHWNIKIFLIWKISRNG